MKNILHFLIISVAVWGLGLAYFNLGISVAPWYMALVVGACLVVINFLVKPVINILTLPINIITLGLFSLVVNGIIFWFLAKILPGFSVNSYTAAFWGALIISAVNWIAGKILKSD